MRKHTAKRKPNKIYIDGQGFVVSGKHFYVAKRNAGAKLVIAGFVYFVILIIIIVFLFKSCGTFTNIVNSTPDENAVIWDGEQFISNPNVNTATGSYIPGFNVLNLVSNSKHQKVNFYNPKENTCLFKMLLFVDNNLVWRSDYINPGYGFYEIDLMREFSPQETTGILKVECYTADQQRLTKSVNIRMDVIIV